MRLATIKLNGEETAALVVSGGAAPISGINTELGCDWETDLLTLIKRNRIREMTAWYKEAGEGRLTSLKSVIPKEEVLYGPLYRNPQKIFGIGLNYKDHAGDLAENAPTGIPASFLKPATTIIGCGDAVKIPVQSDQTTGEAELGVIIGAECENIEPENWLECVAGFTAVIDMTAEDILRLNPRYLTYAKSFRTFFSFGPHLVTPDEVPDVTALVVRTVHNGEIHAQNTVSNMTFPPDFLVSFHSKAFKWSPGDILSTGTPRAVRIQHGDTIECRIDGFEPLVNGVIDKKVTSCPA
ncbi:MAG: fumarylacetoacetate hydrolase family protein [Synergistaceae bacterium]|jgi:2-keto-4-pentenoate hydratase/2-oxohepta-3-ene-1,7-dioic acid hydratase in catechol pathway|nr:fumarylacetoacetate hydrolase family protein [Synergistaceae bacterium]